MSNEGTHRGKHISNPLTIIAIFAGISEVVSAVTLIQVSESAQATLVWFVMLFPTLLAIMFFITVNFNHRSLYAPSDYKDETMFRDLIVSRIEAKNEIGQAQEAVSVARDALMVEIENRMASLGANAIDAVKNTISKEMENVQASLRVAEDKVDSSGLEKHASRVDVRSTIASLLDGKSKPSIRDIAAAAGTSQRVALNIVREIEHQRAIDSKYGRDRSGSFGQ